MTDTSTRLEALLADLPEEKALEIVDFATFLHRQYAQKTGRGTATAILQALDEDGPLVFEEGELDTLLDELEALRQLAPVDRA